jgi:hypothetical protein
MHMVQLWLFPTAGVIVAPLFNDKRGPIALDAYTVNTWKELPDDAMNDNSMYMTTAAVSVDVIPRKFVLLHNICLLNMCRITCVVFRPQRWCPLQRSYFVWRADVVIFPSNCPSIAGAACVTRVAVPLPASHRSCTPATFVVVHGLAYRNAAIVIPGSPALAR